MKKIIIFLCLFFVLCGCSKIDEKELIKDLNTKIKKSNNYELTATLQIFRNEEKYTYDVTSTYQKENNFKVKLINKTNNHEQIILKNDEAVYVLTPSLNKSFKFQSDWPYNNSQIYLLQPIISDLEKDDKKIFFKNKDGYIIESKVNYTNEKDFVKQKVYFDLENNLTKVEILDNSDNLKMILNIISIKYDIDIGKDIFDVNNYIKKMEEKEVNELEKTDSCEISEIVYPMYVPSETYLTSQNVVDTETGERVILTFSGESQFTLVQENIVPSFNESFVYGEPYLVLDTIGTITDTSVSWISEGIEYSIISDVMSIDELLTVAQSISVEPVGK